MKSTNLQSNSAEITPAPLHYNRPPREAERLGLSMRTLAALMADRKIPFLKVGKAVLLNPAEVDAALARNFRVAATGEPRPVAHKRHMTRLATHPQTPGAPTT